MKTLTHREGQIARLLLDGKSRDQIAQALAIKPATVKKHLQRARKRIRKTPALPRMKRTRIRPFSLLPTDNV